MERTCLRRIIGSSVLAFGLSVAGIVSPGFAQETGDAQTTTTERGEEGFDWGLLGLSGWLGCRVCGVRTEIA